MGDEGRLTSQWRERHVTEDDEEDWSYSTAPGQTTLDILLEHFGEAGYQDSSSWQWWDQGMEAASWSQPGSSSLQPGTDGFQLASPKLKLDSSHGGDMN